VDLRATDLWCDPRAVTALLDQGKQLLAEKVETHAEFGTALGLGYSRFQGYFFSRPQLLKARDISGNILYYTRLLDQVSRLELKLEELENTISSDLSLSWKLLRYINSAAMARRQQISSIRQAMLLLGEAQLRRWASVVAVSELNKGHSPELLKLCLVRAHFCEALAPDVVGGTGLASEAFLVGLLSGLDAMLDMEMGQAVPVLNLGSHLNAALLEHSGPLAPVLALVLAYERGELEAVQALCHKYSVSEASLPERYRRAVEWVQQALRED
jgi:EAL and modified HD-GYP domain-containing signal transduction protein